VSAAVLVAADVPKLPPPAARPVDFAADVRPIFAAHCHACHGPEKQKSGFRLDTKEAALKGGDTGKAILPGKSADSPLIRYVAGLDADTVMPPKGDRLTAEQVGILRAWIDQGARWADAAAVTATHTHWAFRPPRRPAVPENLQSPISNPIDAFVAAKRQAAGLTPSPEADRVTLLRRLYLDLTGLPPTPAEVDSFLADTRPGAYERLVDRLLASPHYGERWGRHWLDAARYADSDGYEKDMSRQVWFYRDWVVGALNRDLPYDRFIIEQLAGDLLPSATQDQVVATGFLRNSMLNEEGGVDPEQFRMDAMFDRMDAIGKSVLGLTIQCAQCHNHKFDPLTQEEYYRLFAFLNNDHEARRVVYTPAEQMRIADLRRRMERVDDELRQTTPDWDEKMRAWEESVKGNQPAWATVRVTYEGENDERYYDQKDGSTLVQGYARTKWTAHFHGPSPLTTVRAFRLELLTDPNLPAGGPGRSFMGTCALTEFAVEAELYPGSQTPATDPSKKVKVKFTAATADYANPVRDLEPNFDDRSGKKRVTGPVAFAIDGKDDTAWGIDAGPGRRNRPRVAVFVPDKPLEFPGGMELHFYLKQSHGGWNSDDHMNNNIGRFRLSVTDTADATADPVPPDVRAIRAGPRDRRTPAQTAAVFSHWRTTVPEWKDANDRIEALWREWPAGSTALTLAARDEPRDTHLLKRGDFLKPAQPVGPGVPAFLHPLPPDAPPNRLTFAKWLVARNSPTTARALVNRVWQTYFGTGLVATSEDFGTQAEKPSHPELLDWLAVEFMDRGWSLKWLHRLIVISATYRQSSKVTPELLARDPYNRLLARGPRLRVEGEIVRDIALAASGLLTDKLGGPSVFSPAPAFLFQRPTSYGPFNWPEATGPERYRRALYTFRRRSTPYPSLQTFDVPVGDTACVRRVRSNTPLQALTTLNETVFVECARAFAARVLREGGRADADRLTYAFRLCVARAPTSAELVELSRLLETQQQRLADGWLNPAEIATGSKDLTGPLPPGTTPTQLASYTLVCRVLLNLDETITKE
jgi:mono/diheme cytochrome c family protein